jgi:putative membrane protein
MKKISFSFMLLLASWSFQACNDNKTDSVENAEDSNKQKQTAVKEDDSEFMVKAASGGMMEVELGQLAAAKSTNPRVKSFGSMMVSDHTKANDELKALAAQKNITLPATIGEDHQKHVNDLKEKNGKDFDKAYMDMMVDDHKEDVDHFDEAAKDAKDGDVKSWASKTLPVLRMHLDSAKAINDAIK